MNERPEGSEFVNPYEGNTTADIINVVSEQRKLIAQEMSDYKFPNGRYNISAK